MGIHYASSCIRNTSKSFQYTGLGYRYVIRTDGSQGTRAMLRLPAAMMNLFISKCGWCNTVGMSKQLGVWHQGNGWYLITTLDEEFASFVSKFLARLNRWMFKRNREAERPTVQALVLANNALHKCYQLFMPVIPRKPPTQHALDNLANKFKPNHNHVHYHHAAH